MKSASILVCCAAAALMQPGLAQACGDKLTVMGGGVSFERLGGLALSGTVVMLLEPNSVLRAANDNLKLRQALESAGYKVRAIENPGDLAKSLDQGQAEVVLVSWGDAPRLEAELANRQAAPTVLPVAYGVDAADLAAANSQGTCYVIAAQGQDKEFVKGVARAMKQRERNKPMHCPAAAVASAN
jgi:hypothetical protein